VDTLSVEMNAARKRLGAAENRWNQALGIWAPLKSAMLMSKKDAELQRRFEAARAEVKRAEDELNGAHRQLREVDQVMGERQESWQKECKFGTPVA
jgi:outer membrane murein-binding lipoprotein Lpp